jgi:GTP-binding protein EngB required for normal cell division
VRFWWNLLRRSWAVLLALFLFALPLLVLLPLGLVWLWQEGWLLTWLLIAVTVTLAGYLPALWWRFRNRSSRTSDPNERPTGDHDPVSASSPRDRAAWEEVLEIARTVDTAILTDRDRLLGQARVTIERVARHYHPEDRDPVWSFTVPEILMLTERVSTRLRLVIMEHVPGAHLIEAGHLLRAWEYRPVATTGLRVFRYLHNAWRVTRLANPMSALLAEARQQLVSAAMNEAGDYLRSEGARIWVEEVGRAAIELYSGRLRVDPDRLHALAATEGPGAAVSAAQLPGPLRILIGGQVNAGKSSLVNALLGEPAAAVAQARLTNHASSYPLRREDLTEAVLVDTPGLRSTTDIAGLVQRAWESDLLLWVIAADTASHALDRDALDAVRARFAEDPRRSPIPIIVVLSRIDRLGANCPTKPALDRVATALDLPATDVAPACLEPAVQDDALDALWALLTTQEPQARRCRNQRLHLQAGRLDWTTLLKQTVGAGRALKRRVLR